MRKIIKNYVSIDGDRSMTPIIFISTLNLGVSTDFSHTYVDDMFYFDFFNKVDPSAKFYVSEGSKAYLERHGRNTAEVFIYQPSRVEVPKDGLIIFSGYTEPDVLKFISLRFLALQFFGAKFVLMPTNNLSIGRFKKKLIALKFFYMMVLPFLKIIIAHSNFERSLLLRYSVVPADKVAKKRHHLMASEIRCDSVGKSECLKPIISFFGPVKKDKPIESFLKLIESDTEENFCYEIHGVGLESMPTRSLGLIKKGNVIVYENKRLSVCEYQKRFLNSKYIFLSHTSDFAGKISGNYFDCISFGVPYISNEIEPVLEFQSMYGKMGVIISDEPSAEWSAQLLKCSDSEYVQFQENIKIARKHCGKKEIYNDLAGIFGFNSRF